MLIASRALLITALFKCGFIVHIFSVEKTEIQKQVQPPVPLNPSSLPQPWGHRSMIPFLFILLPFLLESFPNTINMLRSHIAFRKSSHLQLLSINHSVSIFPLSTSLWEDQQTLATFMASSLPLFFFFSLRFYLFICQREWAQADREVGRGRGRSRFPAEQRAQCGTRSQDPGIMTWAEGSCLTNWATQASQI